MNIRQAKKIYLNSGGRGGAKVEATRLWKKRFPQDLKVGQHVVDIGYGCNNDIVFVGNKFVGLLNSKDPRFPEDDEDSNIQYVYRRYFHKEYQVLEQGGECLFCKSRGQDHWTGGTLI